MNWGSLYRLPLLWHLAGIFSTFFVAFLVAQRGLPTPEAGQIWGLVGLTGAAGSFASSLIAATAFGFMAATMSLFLRVKGPARGF